MEEVELLKQLLRRRRQVDPVKVPADSILFKQNKANSDLYIIVDGQVALFRQEDDDSAIRVDTLGPGDLMGLLAYLRKAPSFTTAITTTPARLLVFPWDLFDKLQKEDVEFSRLMGKIVNRNFISRYERVVNLSIERSHLNNILEIERSTLKETISELRETRNRLISQEKLAILGQLVAGLAHELNNPIAAQASASRQIVDILNDWVAKRPELPPNPQYWLDIGFRNEIPDGRIKRKRKLLLRTDFPNLSPAFRERAIYLPEEDWQDLLKDLRKSTAAYKKWEPALFLSNLASTVRTIQVAGERVGDLVKSLKQYSRQSLKRLVPCSLTEGIEDTLRIISNRLHHISLRKEFQSSPTILADPGELNQVWTNILINACDAMHDLSHDQAILTIVVREDEERVIVDIEDSGPGVPENLRNRIFEPSFSTKQEGMDFGLGLGLTISREITERHGGELHVGESRHGGARFSIILPKAI